jgi:hypothetical protein
MAYSVKLVRGNASRELNSAPYSVGLDFAPPAINRENNITSGTSANVSGGGTLVSYVDHDRDFSFTVRILSTTINAAHANARLLASFIETKSIDPLYLEYRHNTSIPVPSWGQLGAPLRYEIVTAHMGGVSSEYTTTGGLGFWVTITLEIKPLAVGLKQRLINASGAIIEDNYGTVDGTSRGLGMFEGTYNKMTNPAFGNATYNNNWTAGGADLIVSKNTDPAFILPGLSCSVKLTATTTDRTFYQSIAAGNTNKHSLSAYIYLPDGGTPSNLDMSFYYDAVKAPTFVSLGNGLWLAYSDNITGISAAKATGVYIVARRTIYLCGFQFEENTHHTPLCYGDQLGCVWATTAHASTTQRVEPALPLQAQDIVSMAAGGVSIVYQPWYANNILASEYFFSLWKPDYSANGHQLYFQTADNKWYLTDGTNTISSGATTWAAYDNIYITATWGPTGLNIYRNGVNIATGATYTPPTPVNSSLLLIGSANPANGLMGGILKGFDVYATELTAAQALAIYNAQYSIINAGGRVSSIPWLWTKDGDGVVDNCDDATRDNWCVAGGIPGSAEANTEWRVTVTAAANYKSMWVMLSPKDSFTLPSTQNYNDLSGTADVGNASGDAYAGDSSHTITSYSLSVFKSYQMTGKLYCFARIGHSTGAGTLSLYCELDATVGVLARTATKVITTIPTAYTWYYLGDMTVDNYSNLLLQSEYGNLAQYIETATSGEIKTDFVMFIPGKVIRIDQVGAVQFRLLGSQAVSIVSGAFSAVNSTYGNDAIDVSPNKYNVVWLCRANDGGAHELTDTFTVIANINPRYTLA